MSFQKANQQQLDGWWIQNHHFYFLTFSFS